MEFGSDNNAGTAPAILDAVVACNAGPAPSYGNDPIMDRVRESIRAIFEAPQAEVFLVATGTAANALAIASFCPPGARSTRMRTPMPKSMNAARPSSIAAARRSSWCPAKTAR